MRQSRERLLSQPPQPKGEGSGLASSLTSATSPAASLRQLSLVQLRQALELAGVPLPQRGSGSGYGYGYGSV